MVPLRELLGRSPVAPPLLLAGKVCYLGCVGFFCAGALGLGVTPAENPIVRGCGVALFAGGVIVVIAALVQLGRSAAVGLPERETELRTQGLYALSRNPVYVGAFFMCAGSFLYAPYAVNAVFLVVAVGVHLRIVAKEEEFLERRFGEQWRAYARRVPRYLGIVRRARAA